VAWWLREMHEVLGLLRVLGLHGLLRLLGVLGLLFCNKEW